MFLMYAAIERTLGTFSGLKITRAGGIWPIAVLLLASSTIAQATDGDLDPTFGTGGKITTDFSSSIDELFKIAVQADSKVVAIGTTRTSSTPRYALVRYNADGTLDTTFGNGGKVITIITNNTGEHANALVIQPDGKILIGGSLAITSAVDSSFALLRYNADGTPDATFGNGGIVTTNVGSSFDSIGALVLQADGKIVAAGNEAFVRPPGEQRNSDIVVARYNSDGTLDATFGNGGLTTSDFGPVPNYFADDATAVLLQPDGKIIVAGDSDGGGYFDFLVARYNTNGTLDATFGNGGFTKTDVGNGFEDGAADAVLQPDGKIILAGAANRSNAANLDYALLRYNPNGTLDSSFGNGGQVVFVQGNLVDEELTSVVLQSDGKIIALGDSNASANSGFLLFRFNPDGSLDSTFGTAGFVRTPFGSNNVQTEALALQPDGKLLAGGFNFYGDSDFLVARYLTVPQPQPPTVVSRKAHGSAGIFDVNLPLTGAPGIECRSGGTNADHQVVFTFAAAVTFGGAEVTPEAGRSAIMAGPATISADGRTIAVNLTSVTDAQIITVTLTNVSNGSTTGNVTVQMNARMGDTNGNGTVNASDVGQTKSQVGLPVVAANFRTDVTANGTINASDIALVKSRSGQ